MEKYDQNKEFLQSAEWRIFQQAVGRKTFHIESEDFLANIIEHILPIVGKYFYCPRGPEISIKYKVESIKYIMQQLIDLAKKENVGWIRIEPENNEILEIIRNAIEIDGNKSRVVKAPHDMQPKEVFVLDISKSEEQLLAEMKSKTRYNINLAKKKEVKVESRKSKVESKKHVEAFLKLTKEMAMRNGITAHPENYYRKMIESLPEEMLSIYVAEFEGEIIATNLVLFYGGTATYLHGASGNTHRNVMAPFLLQWQAILDAKQRGCIKYDFGGVKIKNTKYGIRDTNLWEGITNFKLGFSPNTKPVVFPGTYDIIVNSRAYALYRGLQRAKAFAYRFKR